MLSGNNVFAKSVAEGCLAYTLASLRELEKYSTIVREGGWNDKTHWDLMKQSIAFKEFQNRLQAEGKQGTDDAYFNKAIDGFTDISDRGYELIKNDTYYARLIYTSMGYKLGGPDSGDKYVYEGE